MTYDPAPAYLVARAVVEEGLPSQPWVRSFAAERVVVGGSIARAWDIFAGPLRGLGPGVAVPADRLDDAPLLGAARYAAS